MFSIEYVEGGVPDSDSLDFANEDQARSTFAEIAKHFRAGMYEGADAVRLVNGAGVVLEIEEAVK